jgi:3-oxoacyl-[acyl-carrier-protein] synthase II
MGESIVITGMGILSPIGCDPGSFWESLRTGRSGAGPVDCLDTTDLSRKIACQIREPITAFSCSQPRAFGRAAQLAVAASRQALADASLTGADLSSVRTSVTVGTTMGETQFIEDRLTAEAADWLSAEHVREILSGRPGSIADNVCRDLGVAAPSCDLYGACAAGNMAITSARRQLLDGGCDIALAGGADGFSRLAFLGFMRLRVMAAEICRPFDQQRDGLFVGEGAAVFVLEKESSARARGAQIHARVLGASVAGENYHPTRPHPEGDGLTRSTLAALAEAGLDSTDIDYVCAHGTGTPQNDAIEVAVLEKCFPKGVAFSSIKSLTGHTMGAAAAVEAAACILSLKHQTLIPTWHLDNVLQPCNQDAIKGSPRAAKVRYVLNNSAGFGGYNSSIILAAP